MRFKRFLIPAMAFMALAVVSCAKTEQKSDEWKLVWSEEFDYDGQADTTVWSRIPKGTPDWCAHMSSDDRLYEMRDGNAVLKGIADSAGTAGPVEYLTGGIFTKGKKAFLGGRLEVRAKLQGARGAWPAIWMLPEPSASEEYGSTQWPYGGEIDIMERLNSDSIAYQTVHSDYTYNKGMNDPVPSRTGVIDPDDYNVYAVEMYPDSVRFFINDTHVNTYPRIEGVDAASQFPYYRPMYLMIDMQLGGQWVGRVFPEDLPVEMLVDWVRYYERAE